MSCKACCACGLVTRVALLVLLVAIVPAGYLTYEYYLKPWGEDRLDDYAKAAIAASGTVDLSGALVDGHACIKCPGVNYVYPLTETTHPTYSSFQVTLANNGGWFTSMLMTIGVAIGGGGSLLVALLNAMHGVSSTASALKPTSSTAQNGCGIFEMVFMVSQAQFVTLLGMLQLKGAPLFFLEYAKKLAWTNLQIFPPETSYDPIPLEMGSSRRMLLSVGSVNATGVERYSLLIGAKPSHFFYYTCAALAVALGSVLVVYLLLRLAMGACKRRKVAASLDHRVIWVFLQMLLLVQYVVSMAACFQIYYTVSDSSRSTGDIVLAVVLFAAVCIGLLAFGIIKIARHRDEIKTHGTPEHNPNKPFHLRYSVFYQDFTVENVYFFVGKMLLDIASGAIVGTVQDGALQIAILIAFNVAFLIVLIWRQPFLVPLFYAVAVLAGYLRVVLLLLTLMQTKADVFPQDVRDFVAGLIIAINAVLLMCILIRQFYVLCVAIFRWVSRPKQQTIGDEEMGIPLQDMGETHIEGFQKNHRGSASAQADKPLDSVSSRTSTKLSSSKSRRSQNPVASPIPDSTLFASQPYHDMDDADERKKKTKKERRSLPGYASSSTSSTDRSSSATKGGGRRSLYAQKSRRHRKQFAPVNDEQLPDWAKV